MKKALIIFAILFALTLAIPAIASFVNPPAENTNELVTLFAEETTKADETTEATETTEADEVNEN